jgi:hypothetical protein
MWGAIVGGALSAYGAYRSSKAQQAGIDRQIAAEREARAAAEEAAKFRPVGFTSPYGTMRTEVDAEGRLTDVGFDLDPRFQRRAERYAGLGEQRRGGIDIDPMAAAEARTARLEALAQPGRELSQERMFSNLAAKGLTGIGADIGYGAAVNPYAMALAQSEEAQRARTAAESYDVARRDIATDLQLARSLFGEEQDIYSLGRSEMDYGLALAEQERTARLRAAGRSAESGAAIARMQAQSGNIAAGRYEALLSSVGQLGGRAYDAGLFSGSGMSTPYSQPVILNQYGGNAARGFVGQGGL